MAQTISLSQARAQLSRLLDKIRKNPALIYKITIKGVVVGELRFPHAKEETSSRAGSALRKLAEVAETEQTRVRGRAEVSTQHDLYLYGKERKRAARKTRRR